MATPGAQGCSSCQLAGTSHGHLHQSRATEEQLGGFCAVGHKNHPVSDIGSSACPEERLISEHRCLQQPNPGWAIPKGHQAASSHPNTRRQSLQTAWSYLRGFLAAHPTAPIWKTSSTITSCTPQIKAWRRQGEETTGKIKIRGDKNTSLRMPVCSVGLERAARQRSVRAGLPLLREAELRRALCTAA